MAYILVWKLEGRTFVPVEYDKASISGVGVVKVDGSLEYEVQILNGRFKIASWLDFRNLVQMFLKEVKNYGTAEKVSYQISEISGMFVRRRIKEVVFLVRFLDGTEVQISPNQFTELAESLLRAFES